MMITHSTCLTLKHGIFSISYHKISSNSCLSIAYGDLQKKTPIVRIHSSCLFGEALHGLDCDCRQQLDVTLELIRYHGSGVVIYQYAEGRGVGIEKKIQALEIQRTKNMDTVEAFRSMGLPADLRNYDTPVQALKDLDTPQAIIFASQNPQKIKAMEDAGYNIIKIMAPKINITPHNRPELITKKNKLGYLINDIPPLYSGSFPLPGHTKPVS